MREVKRPSDLARLRRLALASQGLLQARPYGQGLSGTLNAINHIGYVQIDTISVVERAHHHVLYSRVPGFAPAMLNQLLLDRDIFEYWSHAAAFLPICDYRFSLPYKHAIKSGQTHWFKNPDKKLMRELLARIRSDGPLRSRDLEAGAGKGGGWWDWKPAKKALEQLYMQGDLMVSSREGFQKVYDLTERVLPAGINTQMPDIEEFAAHLLEQQLRCHGLVSLKGVAYQRKNVGLRQAIKELVDQQTSQGLLEQVKVYGGEVFLLPTGTFEQPMLRSNKQMRILSPFDNSVIQRDRLKALFEYDYQLECYLPDTKRRFGYFCLPLLFGDVFIGRMDCKVHRKTREFEIKALHFEQGECDADLFAAQLLKAVQKFIAFQGCDSVLLRKVYPKKLERLICRELDAAF